MFRRARVSVVLASVAGLFLIVSTASADSHSGRDRHHRDRGFKLTAAATNLDDGLSIDIERETRRSRRGKKRDRDAPAVLELVVTDGDGKQRTRRIQVDDFESARLTVRRAEDDAPVHDPVAEVPVEPAPVVSHIGRVENDTFDRCRYVFLRDNTEVAAVEFKGDDDQDLELPAGDYRVRVFGIDFFEQNVWKHVETVALTVDADGWRYERRSCDVR